MIFISERNKWFYALCDWSLLYFPSYQQRRVSCHPGDLSRKCHLCHGSCKSQKRGTRPPSSHYKTVRNIYSHVRAHDRLVNIEFYIQSTIIFFMFSVTLACMLVHSVSVAQFRCPSDWLCLVFSSYLYRWCQLALYLKSVTLARSSVEFFLFIPAWSWVSLFMIVFYDLERHFIYS